MSLVFDIETIGADFDQLDQTTQGQLTRWIRHEAMGDEVRYQSALADLKDGLSFSPLTGEIVALGIYDTVRNMGVVYFQSPEIDLKDYQDENFTFKPRTEAEMLAAFWEGAKNYQEFISFNGRGFDVPFMQIRSAVHRIRPTVDLLSNRYLSSQLPDRKHIDLMDQLSFYGAVRRKGSLHLYCRAFGISSPKANGISGEEVGKFFKDHRYQDIAEYNSWDLIATAELYKIWKDYVNMGSIKIKD
ncbi:hypothetical protein HGA64_03680 [Candidatus Falkowbacteria bacterium]|nr:hypothetical protein [Candidatus Falkowbacteria bacterium]